MKRFIFTACAILLAAATMATSSYAADMANPLPRPSYKGPVYVAGFNWTGFYAGINGGYGFGKTNWTNAAGSTGDFDVKGALAGGTLGYNLQTGPWVWGLEADMDASWIKGNTSVAGCLGCETNNQWLATGRARIGYAWNRFLPYITGGAAFGDIKMSFPGASESKTKLGWTAGLGLEYSFMGNWSAKLEYLYVDLGKTTCSATTCGLDTDVAFTANLIRVGLNYRFW
jgi:outer membrane immunogenic protein